MTDQQLIELIQQTPPDELSAEELRLLRQRMAESPAVRDALRAQLQLDQYLSGMLGRPELTAQVVLNRRWRLPTVHAGSLWWVAALAVLVLLCVTLVIAAWWSSRQAMLAGHPKRPAVEDEAPPKSDRPTEPAPTEPPVPPSDPSDPSEPTMPPAEDPSAGQPPAVVVADAPRRLELEAEHFNQGNVRVDRDQRGRAIGVIHTQGNQPTAAVPNFAEYVVDVPAEGLYQFELRYAAQDRRPLRLYFGGALVREDLAGQPTGGEMPEAQNWFVEGVFRLPAGRNTLRLESAGDFPIIDKLALSRIVQWETIEAEAFTRGNVRVDHDEWGKGIGVLLPADEPPSFAEYELHIPRDGVYQLDLRYASGEVSPTTLWINNRIVTRSAAARTTPSTTPDGQRWQTEGLFELHSGRNVLRLGAARRLPLLDKLSLVPLDLAHKPRLPAAVIATSGAEEPWDLVGRQVPFAEACFDGYPSAPPLEPAALKRWFEPVPAPRQAFGEERIGNRVAGITQGPVRLRAPWLGDAVLRMAATSQQPYSIYLYAGLRGVLLRHYPQPVPTWAAYAVSRENVETVEPVAAALLATDSGIGGRTPNPTVQIRHQDGAVVVGKGDVRLLCVPCTSLPTEVYFDGRVAWHDLALYRGGPFPAADEAPRSVVLDGQRPARQTWLKELSGKARLVSTDHHASQLAVTRCSKPVWAAIPLVRRGFYEMVLRLEGADEGTFVYLGDDAGRPRLRLGIVRDASRGWLALAPLPPEAAAAPTASFDFAAGVAPLVGESLWLKLIPGADGLRCLVSGDGAHWGLALPPIPGDALDYASVGIGALPTVKPRRIALAEIHVHELDGLLALAPLELRDEAARLERYPAGDDFGAWQQFVLQRQPPGADFDTWRRACALQTLLRCPSAGLRQTLLRGLLHDTVRLPLTADARRAALDDLAQISTPASNAEVESFLAAYETLFERWQAEGKADAADRVRRALLLAPLPAQTVDAPLRFDVVFRDVLGAVEDRRWHDAVAACRVARFFAEGPPSGEWPGNMRRLQPLVELAEYWAAEAVAELRGERKVLAPELAREARHPLSVELSKDGYNLQAEFQVALDDQQYADACRIIAAASTAELGLLPDFRDPPLYLSLPASIAAAMQDHPGLRQAMNEQFGAAGALRVRQAAMDGDVAAVEACTLQLYGTPAAAEAHRWLGDRALSSGDFVQAVWRFRAALQWVPEAQRADVQARLRLASAMLGRPIGPPVRQPVTLGAHELSAAEFEAIIAGAAGTADAVEEGQVEMPPPGPGALKAQPWARLEGDLGQNAGNIPGNVRDLDWPARQIAVTFDGPRMLVSNRFQVMALEVATGKLAWIHQLGGQQGEAHAWSLVPMRPAVGGDKVFVRMLPANSPPILFALRRSSGELLWRTPFPPLLISDPVAVPEGVLALAADADPEQQTTRISAVLIDPAQGTVRRSRGVLSLQTLWQPSMVCQTAATEDRIVAHLAGSVVCLDATGSVQWVRRQTRLPESMDPAQGRQAAHPPVIAAEWVFCAQPRSPVVDCLALNSGRRRWTKVVPDLRRLLGVLADRLLVQTGGGVMALDTATGKTAWTAPLDGLLEGYLCEGEHLLVCRAQPIVTPQGTGFWPELVWLDPRRGNIVACQPLDGLVRPVQLRFGPLVRRGAEMWGFFAEQNDDARRLIVRLAGDDAPAAYREPLAAGWLEAQQAELAAAAARVLPGWSLLAAAADQKTGLANQVGPQNRVLVTKAQRQSAALVASVDVPLESPRLVVEVGHPPGEAWKLDLAVDGKTIATRPIGPATATEGWLQFEVDLAPYAGRRVWLSATHSSGEKSRSYAYWKRLQVQP